MFTFRPVEDKDFESLYQIWMQDHINPFMSFEQIPRQEFQTIFDSLRSSSDIYVCEEAEKVVAARRIIYCTGEQAHVAEFASFGVHQDYLGKGYGKAFYDFFIDKLQRERPDITRIEISQETDNPRAFNLAKSKKFKAEITVPEWLIRKTGTHKDKWYVGECFLSLLLSKEMEIKSVSFDSFKPQVPVLIQPKAIDLKKMIGKNEEGKLCCYYNGKLQLTLVKDSGVRRYEHIQFWSVKLEPNCNQAVVEQFLRMQAVEATREHKKVEILISDNALLKDIAELGFHYRGQKVASRKVEGQYYNEVYADLSFFSIEDAREVLKKTNQTNEYKLKRVAGLLSECKKQISEIFKQEKIDEYGRLFLENLAFQIVREEFNTPTYTEEKAPWGNLIEQLPGELKENFIKLTSAVNPKFLQATPETTSKMQPM